MQNWDEEGHFALLFQENSNFNSFEQAMAVLEHKQLDENLLLMNNNPMLFIAKVDNNTPIFHQAINGPYSDQYYHTMGSELETLNKMEAFDVVPRI